VAASVVGQDSNPLAFLKKPAFHTPHYADQSAQGLFSIDVLDAHAPDAGEDGFENRKFLVTQESAKTDLL